MYAMRHNMTCLFCVIQHYVSMSQARKRIPEPLSAEGSASPKYLSASDQEVSQELHDGGPSPTCDWHVTVNRGQSYRSLAAVTKIRSEFADAGADAEQQERMEQWYRVWPYVKTCMFVLLALSDLITALCLFCAGSKTDFLCSVDAGTLEVSEPMSLAATKQVLEDHYYVSSDTHHAPTRMGVALLLWILLVAHIIVFFGNVFRIHETGRVVRVSFSSLLPPPFFSSLLFPEKSCVACVERCV